MGPLRRFGIRTFAMARKEVVHIMRDPQVLIFALGMPVLLIFLFGYAVTFDIDRIPIVVVDQDQSPRSRQLVEKFAASSLFEVVARRRDPKRVESYFRAGRAKAAIFIPPGFSRRLRRGQEAQAQLLLDGSDNTTASISLGYATAIAISASRDGLVAIAGKVEPPLEARVRTLFNPGLRSATFLVPGLIVVILVMIAVMLTALTVAREYERGSMEQLFATPVGRLEVILGKLAPYFLIGQVQVLLVVTLGVTIFDVPVRGSLPLLFGVSSIFLLAMLMQGLLISVIARSQMVASQVAAISTFLPAMLLSGFIFPIENMPLPLQVIATILPPQYFVSALRGILLRGNGLDVIWPHLLALTGFFLFMLVVATARFRRTVA